MRFRSALSASLLIFLLNLLSASAIPAQTTSWLPVTPEDLNYQGSPGTHAAYLYREFHTDDVDGFATYYRRIKILREEGKKHGNVEIPFLRQFSRIRDLKARTIRPDGSIVEFKGEVYEKTIVKARGVKLQARTFSMPEVEIGSIIEYRFKETWDSTRLVGAVWTLQSELPTRRARYTIRPWRTNVTIAWTSSGLPPGAEVRQDRSLMVLDVEDVPAFEEEEYMPPDRSLKSRVEFYYLSSQMSSAAQFWKVVGGAWHSVVEDFIGKRKGIEQAVQQIVQPGDAPEAKLRKIYDRVMQVRNLTYERRRTEEEAKREKLKDNNHVEDVLRNGYGYRSEINRLFVALTRAAGFPTEIIRLCERDTGLFSTNLLDPGQLDGEIAIVRVGGNEMYFDPGSPFAPFGLLAWQKTNVDGIRLSKEGGQFVVSPSPRSADALVRREAELEMDPSGTLTGTLRVTFTGYVAQRRRREALDEDDEGRRKNLVDEVKEWLTASAQVTLESVNDWDTYQEPLVAEFRVEIPNLANATGRRMLLPLGVFQSGEKHPFLHARRVHPVYMSYPFQEIDSIRIRLPEGFRVENTPQPRQVAPGFGSYVIQVRAQGNRIELERKLVMEGFYFPVPHYPVLQSFYTMVRTGDEDLVVLQAGELAQRD